MAFADTETSVFDSEPIELYRFIGTTQEWTVTSYAKDVTFGADTYTSLPGLKRSVLKIGTQEETNLALDVEMPFDHPLVRAYAYQNAPPTLSLEIRRAHASALNDSALMWQGKILSFAVEGRTCKLRGPSLFSYLISGATTAPKYQSPCNHVLYSTECGADAAANQHVTTVTSVGVNTLSLASNPFADGECNAGEIVWAGGQERRMVISNVLNDFTITFPFSGIGIGDSVVLRRGCDHSYETCKAKFANGINFGGCPNVPTENPFTSTL